MYETLPDGRKKQGDFIYPKRKTDKFPFPAIRKKRGEISASTGLIFERYNRSPYGCQEVWVSQDKFDKLTKISRDGARRRSIENPAHVRALKRKYKKENPEKVRESNRKGTLKRKSTVMGRLICNYRTRTSLFHQDSPMRKNNSTTKLIGCTKEQLRAHLQSKFTEGMSWENYGNKRTSWSVDHIIPLDSAETIEQLEKLMHYTNLQPLWHIENIRKKNKMPGDKGGVISKIELTAMVDASTDQSIGSQDSSLA